MMFVPSRDLGPGAGLGATKPLLSAQWMAAAGTLFPAFPASSQHSAVHNTQCWGQIVGTEQNKHFEPVLVCCGFFLTVR